jgi:hypothetical protein
MRGMVATRITREMAMLTICVGTEVLQGYRRRVTCVLQGCYKGVAGVLQRCYKDVKGDGRHKDHKRDGHTHHLFQLCYRGVNYMSQKNSRNVSIVVRGKREGHPKCCLLLALYSCKVNTQESEDEQI